MKKKNEKELNEIKCFTLGLITSIAVFTGTRIYSVSFSIACLFLNNPYFLSFCVSLAVTVRTCDFGGCHRAMEATFPA